MRVIQKEWIQYKLHNVFIPEFGGCAHVAVWQKWFSLIISTCIRNVYATFTPARIGVSVHFVQPVVFCLSKLGGDLIWQLQLFPAYMLQVATSVTQLRDLRDLITAVLQYLNWIQDGGISKMAETQYGGSGLWNKLRFKVNQIALWIHMISRRRRNVVVFCRFKIRKSQKFECTLAKRRLALH